MGCWNFELPPGKWRKKHVVHRKSWGEISNSLYYIFKDVLFIKNRILCCAAGVPGRQLGEQPVDARVNLNKIHRRVRSSVDSRCETALAHRRCHALN